MGRLTLKLAANGKVEKDGNTLQAAFAGTTGPFRPCAFFDDRLDCIRVIARDCSVLENRINPALTVLEDNYSQDADRTRYVGFTLKGARHFCSGNGFDLNAPIEISALLDAVLRSFPGIAVEMFAIARPLVKDEKIERVEMPGVSGPLLQPA
jgi:hypothetical protein